MDWFLYDNGLRHERVKGTPIHNYLDRNRTLNRLAKIANLAKWLSFRLRFK